MGRGTISPMPRTPELLLPAGSLEKMRAAYDFGADAVYAGQPRYSLRARNNEFKIEQLAQGISEAKQRGKKLYVTSNLIAHNDKIRTYMRDIEPIIEMKPDGIIMADPGLIMMVREKWPEVPIHLSVQANTTNFATVKFWQKMGQECPDMEIEVFVHGALCIAYSGRCLLSGYFNRRDPNQCTCTNACRWNYKTQSATEQSDSGEAIPIKLEGVFNFEQEQADAQAAAFAPSAWPRSVSTRSRSKAAPSRCTTWRAWPRSTATPSTTRPLAGPSTATCSSSSKAWPAAATPRASWSAAPRRTTRTTSPATPSSTAASSAARSRAWPKAGPRGW